MDSVLINVKIPPLITYKIGHGSRFEKRSPTRKRQLRAFYLLTSRGRQNWFQKVGSHSGKKAWIPSLYELFWLTEFLEFAPHAVVRLPGIPNRR